MRITLFAVTGPFLGLVPAFAHGYAGGRYFPATVLTEDPFVADELALPTFTHRKGGEEPGAREDEWEFEFAKRVSDNFALSIEGGWSREKGDENSVDGFANLTLGAKYQLLVDEDAEFALAAGLGVELGGTGSAHLDVADFNTYEPAVLFGKGFGDLGEATSLLRPFAVTGFAGVSIPEHGHGNLVYGGAVEYSMAYLHASVRDMDLPDWVNQLTPLVEFSVETPLSGGERTTGSVNPGLIWSGQSVQIAVEAMMPVNRDSGDTVGITAQLHFYLDDIFPDTLGRPIFQ